MSLKNHQLAYLAIPYSGIEEYSFKLSCAIAARLMEDGELIFSPIGHSHPIHFYMKDFAHDHDFWMEYNKGMMEKCQKLYVVTIAKWEKSIGVAAEIEWFLDRKLPVYLIILDYDTGALVKKRYYPFNNHTMTTEQLNIFNNKTLVFEDNGSLLPYPKTPSGKLHIKG